MLTAKEAELQMTTKYMVLNGYGSLNTYSDPSTGFKKENTLVTFGERIAYLVGCIEVLETTLYERKGNLMKAGV